MSCAEKNLGEKNDSNISGQDPKSKTQVYGKWK